jgi:diketogulonate reductase-like aldo/keto reductase
LFPLDLDLDFALRVGYQTADPPSHPSFPLFLEARSSGIAGLSSGAAQVALKWLLDQDGVAAIPKASRAESQKANLDALKVKLDDEDRKAIAALPKDKRFVNPGFAPDWD